MPKKSRYLVMLLMLSGRLAFAQTGAGSVEGTVTDQESGQLLPFVKVQAFQNGQLKGYATTDFNGKYSVEALASGEYIVQVEFVGYTSFRQAGVVVSSGLSTNVPIVLSPSAESLGEQPALPPAAHPVPVISPAARWALALMMFAVALSRV